MRASFLTVLLASGAFSGLLFLSPPTASAGIDACGDIHIEADATCEVQVSGGCEVMCEPISFRAACAAELHATCEGGCTAEVTQTCVEEEVNVCQTECELNPGTFTCEFGCSASIEADCSAQCEGMASDQEARAECEASCEATFSAECTAGCSGTAPSLTCEEKCMVVSQSRCKAKTTVDCQVDCQAEGYVDCYAELSGGCEAECQRPEGALFCDGQYVDSGDNLQMCIDAIQAAFDINVDVSAQSSGECTDSDAGGTTCMGEASVSVGSGCSAAPGVTGPAAPGLAFLGLLGLVALRRRR